MAVDLHLPSIYHFFSNKEALYGFCVDSAFQRTADRLKGSFERADANADVGSPDLLSFVSALCEAIAADEELRAFLLQRHRQGSSWLAGTPLQAVVARFAALLPSGVGSASRSVHAADRLIGLAIGDALGRATSREAWPEVDPAALLQLLLGPGGGRAAI